MVVPLSLRRYLQKPLPGRYALHHLHFTGGETEVKETWLAVNGIDGENLSLPFSFQNENEYELFHTCIIDTTCV